MEDIGGIGLLLIVTLTGAIFLYRFLSNAVEPLYIMVTGRPMYVHFYPVKRKLSASQSYILRNEVPFYHRLRGYQQGFFEHRVASFLRTYPIYGKGGMLIDDRVRVLIASTYVMLTFGMRRYRISAFERIVVYPDQYRSAISEVDHKGEFNPAHRTLVFSWLHFAEGLREGSDNLNLGIHEFAHAVHFHGMQSRDASAVIFADKYIQIVREVSHPPNAKRLVESEYFRIYAYTNPFEFLAVILEHFFETPARFREEFPQLYENVRQMINFDPDLHGPAI